ncbi:MAG: deazaflavin-dependent oxidoreductase (nitroreductase family) [Bacteroidia bacterium]|jgi:deazaflavin-dependent oxidoreductase (nitroreductase family)
MADWKIFSKAHQFVYRLSGGKIGSRLAGVDMVVIYCIGRKSGQPRPTPIACYPYGNNVAVVASNNGSDTNPVWLLNLRATPNVEIQLGSDKINVLAEEVIGMEREEFWPQIVKLNPLQQRHQDHTSRVLPVIYLRRV